MKLGKFFGIVLSVMSFLMMPLAPLVLAQTAFPSFVINTPTPTTNSVTLAGHVNWAAPVLFSSLGTGNNKVMVKIVDSPPFTGITPNAATLSYDTSATGTTSGTDFSFNSGAVLSPATTYSYEIYVLGQEVINATGTFTTLAAAPAGSGVPGTVSIIGVIPTPDKYVNISGIVTWPTPLGTGDVGTGNNKVFAKVIPESDYTSGGYTVFTTTIPLSTPGGVSPAATLSGAVFDSNGKVVSNTFSISYGLLLDGTKYDYKVYIAGNEPANIMGSFMSTGTTLGGPGTVGTGGPGPASPYMILGPMTLNAPTVTSNSATISGVVTWSTPLSPSEVGADPNRIFGGYVKSPSTSSGAVFSEMTLGSPVLNSSGKVISNTFSITFTGLESDTEYGYFVYIHAAPSGPSTPTDTFKTKPDSASGGGATLGASNISQTHATLVVTLPKNTNSVDVFLNKGSGAQLFFSASASNPSSVISNLTPNTTYSMYLTKSGSATKLTGLLSFTTLPVVAQLSLTNITSTGAVFNVTFYGPPSSPVLLYGKDIKNPTTVSLTQSAPPTPLSDVSLYTATLTGLTPNTPYQYVIQGASSVIYIPQFYFLTLRDKGTPPTIAKIDTSGGGGTLATSSWTGKFVVCYGVTSAEQQDCTFGKLMDFLKNIIDFLIFVLAPIIATIIVLYGGFLILTAGDSAEKVSQAKGMFTKGIVGLMLAMGAWLIVKFVLVSVGYNTTLFPTFY